MLSLVSGALLLVVVLAYMWVYEPSLGTYAVPLLPLTLLVAGAIKLYRYGSPRRQKLTLDQDGLTFTLLGRSNSWRWEECSTFELSTDSRARSRIEFKLAGETRVLSSCEPWFTRLTRSGPVARIEDLFDTPLPDIAAKLNAYRERALGLGSGSMEQTP